MASWHKLGLLPAAILITLSLSSGCGGRSAEDDEPRGGNGSGVGGAAPSKGGKSGVGGGSSLGGSSAGGAPSSGGSMTTGGSSGGEAGCVEGGKSYRVGESFKAGDGCNTCTCFAPNVVGCTLIACPNQCEQAQAGHAAALDIAKRCDPMIDSEQCTALATSGLNCSCPTFVNPVNADALKELTQWSEQYKLNMCGQNIICGACLEPSRGICGPMGRCQDVFNDGAHASCLVNGKVYPHGAGGIKDPVSCNTCGCFDGKVGGCTEIGCEMPCPPNAALSQRCAQCGLAGGCSVVETGCFEVCDGTCPKVGEQCIDGVCMQLCE